MKINKLKIAILVLNEYEIDSRVIKEVSSLNKIYDVGVYALNNGSFDLHENRDGVNIFKHITYKKPYNRYLKKLVQLWVYSAYFLTTLLKLSKYDVVHCNDLETLPIGVMAKLFNKELRIVYDAHEYETETLWLKGYKKKLAKVMEEKLIKYVDATITVSNAIADEYARLYNITKPGLVLNTPVYTVIEKKDIFRETFKIKNEQCIFLYQGRISEGRGIEILLETFTSVDDSKVIVFMGYGPLETLVKSYAEKYKNIFYHEAVSPKVLLDYTSSADFGILFYENNCLNHYYCSPNKMFEYIMAEIPVVVSNLFEMEKIVKNNNIGVVAEENTPNGLKQAIENVSNMDRNLLNENTKQLKQQYNWEEQEKVLLALYAELDMQ